MGDSASEPDEHQSVADGYLDDENVVSVDSDDETDASANEALQEPAAKRLRLLILESLAAEEDEDKENEDMRSEHSDEELNQNPASDVLSGGNTLSGHPICQPSTSGAGNLDQDSNAVETNLLGKAQTNEDSLDADLENFKRLLSDVSLTKKAKNTFQLPKMLNCLSTEEESYGQLDQSQKQNVLTQLLSVNRLALPDALVNVEKKGVLVKWQKFYGFSGKTVHFWDPKEPLAQSEISASSSVVFVSEVSICKNEEKVDGLVIGTTASVSLHTIVPTMKFVCEIDIVGASCAVSTCNGRIFIGCTDGSVQEIIYGSFWLRGTISHFKAASNSGIQKLLAFQDGSKVLAMHVNGDLVLLAVKDAPLTVVAALTKVEMAQQVSNLMPTCNPNLGEICSLHLEESDGIWAAILTTSTRMRLIVTMNREDALQIKCIWSPPCMVTNSLNTATPITVNSCFLNGDTIVVEKSGPNEFQLLLLSNSLVTWRDTWRELVERMPALYQNEPTICLINSELMLNSPPRCISSSTKMISLWVLGDKHFENYQVCNAYEMFQHTIKMNQGIVPPSLLSVMSNEQICALSLHIATIDELNFKRAMDIYRAHGNKNAHAHLLGKQVSAKLIGMIMHLSNIELEECNNNKNNLKVLCPETDNHNSFHASVKRLKHKLENFVVAIEYCQNASRRSDKRKLKTVANIVIYLKQVLWLLDFVLSSKYQSLVGSKFDDQQSTIEYLLNSHETLCLMAKELIRLQAMEDSPCLDDSLTKLAINCPTLYKDTHVCLARAKNLLKIAAQTSDAGIALHHKTTAVNLLAVSGPEGLLADNLVVEQLLPYGGTDIVWLVKTFTEPLKDTGVKRDLIKLLTNDVLAQLMETADATQVNLVVQYGLRFPCLQQDLLEHLWEKDGLRKSLETCRDIPNYIITFLEDKKKNLCAGSIQWINAVNLLKLCFIKSEELKKAKDMLFGSATSADVEMELETRMQLLKQYKELVKPAVEPSSSEDADTKLCLLELQKKAVSEAESIKIEKGELGTLKYKILVKEDLYKEAKRLKLYVTMLATISKFVEFFDLNLCKELWGCILHRHKDKGFNELLVLIRSVGQELNYNVLPMELLTLELETLAFAEVPTPKGSVVAKVLAEISNWQLVKDGYSNIVEGASITDPWLMRHVVKELVQVIRFLLSSGNDDGQNLSTLKVCLKCLQSNDREEILVVSCCMDVACKASDE